MELNDVVKAVDEAVSEIYCTYTITYDSEKGSAVVEIRGNSTPYVDFQKTMAQGRGL